MGAQCDSLKRPGELKGATRNAGYRFLKREVWRPKETVAFRAD